MKVKRIIILLCSMIILFTSGLPIVLAEDTNARVDFIASEPDANGYFTLSMSVANAKFNAFQFVLRYNTESLQTVDYVTHENTDSFSKFSHTPDNLTWLSKIGTGIDSSLGLIDFSGYVTPGTSPSYNAEEIVGQANIGNTPVILFEFAFRQLGTEPIGIELAKFALDKPSREYFPEGGALANAGKSIDVIISFLLPQELGENIIIENPGDPVIPDSETPVVPVQPIPTDIEEPLDDKTPKTVIERLKETLILQIGNYAAADEGALCHIYPGEKSVFPYLKDNRTFVPFRFIADRLGYTVEWNEATRMVTFSNNTHLLQMKIGAMEYTVDGISYPMDTAAEISHDRTMVPIRFIAQALGQAVEWDSNSQMVYITRSDIPWNFERELEKQATSDVSLVLSPLLRDFV